jgi:hypothetical protein
MSAEAEREVSRVEVLHSPGDDKVAIEYGFSLFKRPRVREMG